MQESKLACTVWVPGTLIMQHANAFLLSYSANNCRMTGVDHAIGSVLERSCSTVQNLKL